jgi:hypothetical protein
VFDAVGSEHVVMVQQMPVMWLADKQQQQQTKTSL